MRTLIRIAWRNIWRNKKRSLMMILAITVGLCGGIFAAALSLGLMEQRFELTIVQHISHIQVHHPEFIKDQSLRHGIERDHEIEQFLSHHDDVDSYSPRIVTNGMFASANLSRGVNIIGVDPEKEAATSGLSQNMFEGAFLEQGARNPILVGRRLADRTRLQPGSRVVLTFQGHDGELHAGTFRVAGIFQTTNSTYDESNVYVLRTDLASMTGQDTFANEFAIMVNDIDRVDIVTQLLREEFPALSVRGWAEIAPELSYLQEMAQTMLMFILVIILMALAFGLVNTMLMAVHERIQEIGVLMAIGMGKKRIFFMITIETVYLTFLGALGGIIAGSLAIRIMQKTGLNLGAVGGDTLNEWGFPSVVYPNLEPSFFGMLVILVVITSMITSIFPSLKALRLRPAEAVKKE